MLQVTVGHTTGRSVDDVLVVAAALQCYRVPDLNAYLTCPTCCTVDVLTVLRMKGRGRLVLTRPAVF